MRKEEPLVRSWPILADLCKADPHILARYMGEAGAAAFFAYHAAAAAGLPPSHYHRRWA